MKRFLIGLSVLTLMVTGALVWYVRPRDRAFYTDAETIRQPAQTAPTRDILWQTPLSLPEIINSDTDDYEPRLSADGQALFFVRGKAGQDADIYSSKRTHEGWSEPEPLAGINTEYDELGPEPAPDGKSLYFYSDRPGGAGGYDLWVAHRTDREAGPYREPINLGPLVNSPYSEYGPALTQDGERMYFASNRPQPADEVLPDRDAWPATVREDLYRRDYDLYSAPIAERGVGVAEPIAALNTPDDEGSPAVSPAGDFLYFCSDRPGGLGGFDLYRSRRLRGLHQPPDNLGAAVNTDADELDPGLGMGGYALYFSSNRPTGTAPDDTPAYYNLYRTTSREVFTETETHRASIDWALLWSQIGPNLLLALLALLLLVLLLLLMRQARNRQLSLLARCLLASVFLHLLLMLVFNFWEVTAALTGVMRRGGAIQIAVVSPARGDELGAQIRGALTDVNAPAPVVATLERSDLPFEVRTAAVMNELNVDRGPIQVRDRIRLKVTPRESADMPHMPSHRPAPPSRPPAPASVDLALPADARPVRDSETPEPAGQSPAPTVTYHAEFSATVRGPTEAALQVTLAPPENGPTPPVVDRSLARPNTYRDARVTLAESILPEAKVLVPGERPDMELSLPSAAPNRAQPVEEPAASVAAPVHRSASHRPAYRPEPTVVQPALALIQPDPTPRRAEVRDSSPPFDADRSARDMPTPASAPMAAPITLAELPKTPPSDVSLPMLEEPDAEPVPDESAMRMVAVPGRALRARPDVAALRRTTPDLANLVVVNPKADAPEPDVPPAWSPSAVPTDRTVPQTAVASIPNPARHVLPQALELDLRLPVQTEIPRRPPFGRMSGLVIDVVTGQPLEGAVVRLDLPQDASVEVVTDGDGRFELEAPEVPDFFVVSASSEDYVPESVNLSKAMLRSRRLEVHFQLQPERDDVLVVEAEPEVHHLGNGEFEGRINSRFQKEAEGVVFVGEFELAADQLTDRITRAEIRMLAKGVQCEDHIRINAQRLDRGLPDSPRDGSFGVVVIPLEPSLLNVGVNILEISSTVCSSDLDDFEFVNIQIHLAR